MSRYRRTSNAPSDEVTLGELATLCLSEHARAVNTHQPSPWDRLVAELRQAGYLSSEEDLVVILGGALAEELIEAGYLTLSRPQGLSSHSPTDRSKLDLPVPRDMVERLWAMIEPIRYVATGGYLQATYSTSAPYPPTEAIDQFGLKLVVQARASANQFRAPLPSRALARRLDRALRRVGPLLVVGLSPLLAPLWVVSAASAAGQRTRSRGPARGHRTGSELNQMLVYGVCLAIPLISVAAWYAIWATHLPPHGPTGRWVALGLAALFGAQNMIIVYLLTLGFAMDGSEAARQRVARPIRYFVAQAIPVLVMIVVVNAPLALILLVIRVITAAV